MSDCLVLLLTMYPTLREGHRNWAKTIDENEYAARGTNCVRAEQMTRARTKGNTGVLGARKMPCGYYLPHPTKKKTSFVVKKTFRPVCLPQCRPSSTETTPPPTATTSMEEPTPSPDTMEPVSPLQI